MLDILQWNARSLIANGQELKYFIDNFNEKPKLVCIQETWLKAELSFVIPGYVALRKDRETAGGGCATFVLQGVQYREKNIQSDYECVVTEVWGVKGSLSVVNFYNPCQALDADKLDQIMEQVRPPVVWIGDFNAHNPLWGSKNKDRNGIVVEDMLDKHNLVIINDGRPTRCQVGSGRFSHLDLAFTSAEIARTGQWDVMDESTMGSDHFPVWIKFGVDMQLGGSNGGAGRFNYQRADWDLFLEHMSTGIEEVDDQGNTEDWSKSFSNVVKNAAEKAIPIKRQRERNKMVPWWNQDCTDAIRARNKAFKRLCRRPIESLVIEYKKLKAMAKRTIKKVRKESWQKFCGTLGKETPLRRVWNMIHRMSGINRALASPVLIEEGKVAVTEKEKSEMLVEAFQQVHSEANVSVEGQLRRRVMLDTEGYKLGQSDDNSDVMNLFFSMRELRQAIKRGSPTTPGRDGLGYEIFQHMDEWTMGELLALINNIWEEGKLPAEWKHAVIVPVLKPGKKAESPGSYRPIALTAVMCKIMERMVTDRLVYRLEQSGYFSSAQNGFRLGRSTMDSVLLLDRDVRKAFFNKEVVVAIFLDIEKAYDMLWKEGLVIKLYDAGIRGRMLNWIKDFLESRHIQVRVGGTLSSTVLVDNGTPQGSVISPVLFNIMVNDIFDSIGQGFEKSLFADDGAVWKRGRNVYYLFKKMQGALDQVQRWATKWGFRLSVAKSKFIVFGRKYKLGELDLKLYGQPLEKVTIFKFLGVWFDQGLTYKVHICKMIDKCNKVINILRCLAGSTWGAGRQAMMMVYRAMIRSVLDYGCIAYGAAANSVLQLLDVVQAKALRICTGAFKTTAIPALLVESGETPLSIRRTKLALNYCVKLKGSRTTLPAVSLLSECWEFVGKGGRLNRRSFLQCVSRPFGELGLGGVEVVPSVCWPSVPLWMCPEAEIDLSIKKATNDGLVVNYPNFVEEHLHKRWKYFIQIYTDGSRDPETGRVGCGFYVPQIQLRQCYRLPDRLSVFTAELCALLWALLWVESNGEERVVICSDSMAALMVLEGGGGAGARPDILYEILVVLRRLEQHGCSVGFVWVPAHVGVKGNEVADGVAKQALGQHNVEIRIAMGQSEGRCLVNEHMVAKWQEEWDLETKGRHYYQIQRSVKKKDGVICGKNRRDQTILTRLRLGHCGLAKTLAQIGKHRDGLCVHCNKQETVAHVLLECREYDEARRKLFIEVLGLGIPVVSLKTLLNSDKNQSQIASLVLGFVFSTGLYQKI